MDTIIYIGTKKYSIDFLLDEMAVLRDQTYPLFTEKMPREEFDRKVHENPANDHLRRPLSEAPAENKTMESIAGFAEAEAVGRISDNTGKESQSSEAAEAFTEPVPHFQ